MTLQRPDNPENLFVGVNEALDPNNPSDLEKKHIPAIEAPREVRKGQYFDVRVAVGKAQAHPNEHTHFINAIELYADETGLARVDLTAGLACPRATFCVSLRHPVEELRALAHCNLHGAWMGAETITVTQ